MNHGANSNLGAKMTRPHWASSLWGCFLDVPQVTFLDARKIHDQRIKKDIVEARLNLKTNIVQR